MEYSIWNFPNGLWTASNLAAFNGTTLTPIATTIPANTATAGYSVTANFLNPIITAAAAFNININNDLTQQSNNSAFEQNSEANSSNSISNDQNSNVLANFNNADLLNQNNLVHQGNENHVQQLIGGDLSNAADDNAVDHAIKINRQFGGFFAAQQYHPQVYNIVLNNQVSNQNVQTSETEESSEEDIETADNVDDEEAEENCSSSDNNNYSDQFNDKNQPSTSVKFINNNNNQRQILSNEVYKCPISGCDFQATEGNGLEQHVLIHGDKYEFQTKGVNTQRVRYEREEYHCSMCSYTCTTERAYLRHLRMHSLGESPDGRLSCPVCGRDRVGETALAKHMNKHRDDRYICCDICVFRTVQLKKLIQHRRMHTGEKPHLCPHCSYRSARRDNLRSHVRRVHKRDNLWCDTFSPRGMLLTPSSSKTQTDSSTNAIDNDKQKNSSTDNK